MPCGCATSRSTCDELLYLSLFGFRKGTYEALNRLQHDSPLRFGQQHGERAEFQLHIRRKSDTELWVIRHLLTGTSAGRRPSAAVGLSSISS
jgi:hypothetical protein